jgi:hypothetical protein
LKRCCMASPETMTHPSDTTSQIVGNLNRKLMKTGVIPNLAPPFLH